MTWARKNVPTLVTWVLILLTAASALGYASANVSDLQHDVADLQTATKVAARERGTMVADVRVNAERDVALSSRVDRFGTSLDRLEDIVRKLEAIAARPFNGGVR